MGVTSGTVSLIQFNTGKLLDRAFGRCQLNPQQITPEYLSIGQDLLYLFLSTLSQKGIPLWAVPKIVVPIYDAVQDVPLPLGTVDVLNANLRSVTQLQLPAPGVVYVSSAGGIAANAFDNNLATACTQTAANGYLQVQFPSTSQPVVFGLLPNASGTWSYTIETSVDGVTFTPIYTVTNVTVTAGQWLWQDIEGIPESGVTYVRLQATGGTTLNVTEFVCGASPQEIPVAKINRDDYSNLPNKWFTGRPLQFWYNKTIPQPLMVLWPVPQQQFTFSQLVLYTTRYIQDVGTLTQSVEIPQRWFLAVMTETARQLMLTIPEVMQKMDPTSRTLLVGEADRLLKDAWGSENDNSNTTLRPWIWNYTR